MAFYSNEGDYNKFLIKHNLTDNHFSLLWSLTKVKFKEARMEQVYQKFSLNHLNEEDRELFCKGQFKNKVNSSWMSKQDIDYLEMKGYLNPVLFKSNFPDTHDVTEKFYKELFIETDIAFQELYESYPDILTIQGSDFHAKACDIDELKMLYKKKIGNSLPKHNKILEALDLQIEANMVNMKIDNWVKGELWNTKLELKPVVTQFV